jgi:type II pantothenate kinase
LQKFVVIRVNSWLTFFKIEVTHPMSDLPNTPTIGIDRGASSTDFAVIESGSLLKTLSVEKRDWRSIVKAYDRLTDQFQKHHIVFTGSTADMPPALKRKTQIISEIDAIGFGGSALANYSDCVVASIGTGTAIVHFAENGARHVGGTGVGGGTIKGLSSIICDLDDPLQIEASAQKGNPSKINLTISDLGYEGLSFLGSDMTASNFADVKSNKPEDLAAGILRLVGETVGIIASMCAREFKCQDRSVIVGKVANSRFIRHTIDLVGKLYETKFTFPENPGYATAYGAAMKYLYDQRTENRGQR